MKPFLRSSSSRQQRWLLQCLLWLCIGWMPALAWANGKICLPGQACSTLFRVCQGVALCGLICFLVLLVSSKQWLLRTGMFMGIVNVVIGGRFLSNPHYELFANHSQFWLLQLGLGMLLFAFSSLQILRRRREQHS